MQTRRQMLSQAAQLAGMLAALGLLPDMAQAQVAGFNAAAFDAKSLADVMKALGAAAPVVSRDVVITGPDIAENGAVVPVGVSTALPGVKRLREEPVDAVGDIRRHRCGRGQSVDPRQDGPVFQRLRGGDHDRRQGAVRRQGSQGHARRLWRLSPALTRF